MGIKIIYGDSEGQISAEAFAKFKAMDTFDSGDDTYAVDTTHDGILDSDQGEFDLDSVGELLAILSGETEETVAAPKKTVSSTTPNGRTFPGTIIDIPGGTFEMGSINGRDDEHTSDGKTVTVTMSAYRLAEHETTVGEYKAYLALTGDLSYSKLPDYEENRKGDNYPVVGLTYAEMQTFCEYYGGTLPTAAQIEYVSEGRSHTDPYGTPITEAISYANNFRTTTEVCGSNKERANDLGVCDLAGNVGEATADGYDANFYDSMSTSDPKNSLATSGQAYYELRGGSWHYLDDDLRSSNRDGDNPDHGHNYVGFRCAFPPRTPTK